MNNALHSTGSAASAALWLDEVASLARAVAMMEKLPADARQFLCQEGVEWAKSLKLKAQVIPGEVKNLGIGGVMAMMGLKQSGRWFSQDAHMLKLLNDVYQLQEQSRNQVGTKLLLGVQAVDSFNQSGQSFDTPVAQRLALHKLIKSVFDQDLGVFQEQGKQKSQEKLARHEAYEAEKQQQQEEMLQLAAQQQAEQEEMARQQAEEQAKAAEALLQKQEEDRLKAQRQANAHATQEVPATQPGVRVVSKGSEFKIQAPARRP